MIIQIANSKNTYNVEKELCLTVKEYAYDEVDALLAWADITYVGGGNAAYMMEIWRKSGIDKKLKEVYFSSNSSARTYIVNVENGLTVKKQLKIQEV